MIRSQELQDLRAEGHGQGRGGMEGPEGICSRWAPRAEATGRGGGSRGTGGRRFQTGPAFSVE